MFDFLKKLLVYCSSCVVLDTKEDGQMSFVENYLKAGKGSIWERIPKWLEMDKVKE
jgi:hypothetical protein